MLEQNQNFEDEIKNFIGYYQSRVVEGLLKVEGGRVDELSDKVATQIQSGNGRIFAFGNGGSEAIAEHFIYSLEDAVSTNFPFDAYINPKLSGAANVFNEYLFNRTLERHARKDNLVFLITASGNSENINNASRLCREKGIETVAISRNGRIASDTNTKADTCVVIEEDDQQILEDISQSLLHLVVNATSQKLEGKYNKNSVGDEKKCYAEALQRGYGSLEAGYFQKIILDVIRAYKNGNTVRVDGPDDGGMAIVAAHTSHNFKWDGLSNIEFRPRNRVYSGIPTYHFTGVGNDGGDNFQYAVEVADNAQEGDIQIIFASNFQSVQTSSLMRAAENRGVHVYPFCFNLGDKFAVADVAQMAGHTLGRILNTYLLLEQGTIRPEQFGRQLRQDLALLRQKELTREKLERKYGG